MFSKKYNLWIYSQKFYDLFLLYLQIDDYQYILKLSCWPLVSSSYKAFLKDKKIKFLIYNKIYNFFPLIWFILRHVFTFADVSQYKYKQFDVCIVSYYQQQKYCLFVKSILSFFFSFLCNFHILFGTYTLPHLDLPY